MTSNFEDLATSVKKRLELRFGKENLEKEYLYLELARITKEWTNETLTRVKTGIGLAAVKQIDSGLPEDRCLARDLCTLDDMFRRRQRKELILQIRKEEECNVKD